jgi:hypothetical protein
VTKEKAKKLFVAWTYESEQSLRNALKADWHAVQLAWSCFTDMLCKEGDITQHQYDTWLFPWPKKN